MFCFCAQTRRLARTLTARYDAALAGAGLTAAQFETLSTLAAIGKSSGRTLAAKLAVDKTTLSRNLKPMVAAALVEARSSEEDGRSVLYAVTAPGRRRVAKAMPLWQAAHDATGGMLGAQATDAERVLRNLVQTLQ